MEEFPKSDYREYPKTLPRDDIWGQVRRTINGRRISEAEVRVIVESVKAGLGLEGDDVLLDLACGNGALTERLFGSCGGVIGVDLSEYLIEIAKERFERPPAYVFLHDDVVRYVTAAEPGRITKVLCYAGIQYLSPDDVRKMLRVLGVRFTRVKGVMLGNVPDKDRADRFFADPARRDAEVADPTAQIGVWYSQSEIAVLAADCGWAAAFTRLPEHVFNARYRYDAILTR
jgi:hypothetical protein